MIRTQIQLTEAQERKLREIARRESLSFAAVVRWCVDRTLASEVPSKSDQYERAARVVGAFQGPAKDLSTKHDRYLEQAYE